MNPETYYFDSFSSSAATTYYDSGTVETTGVTSNGYSEVEVKTNPIHPDWVGQKFYVASDAKTDGSEVVQLYSDAGTTGVGVYVKIYAEAPARNVSFTVNDGTDPVSGASVVIDNGTAKTTGGAGGCTASLVDGSHSVKVTKDGFNDYTGTVTVSYEDTSFTISLTETG